MNPKKNDTAVCTGLRKIPFLIAGIVCCLGLNAQPNERVVELEAYEVRGFRDSLELARLEARNSLNLKDVIAADQVGQLPDSNIAEAINRAVGIYLRPDQGEGRYVSIRGVDPILNNVTFNGQTIAVSDWDGRSGRAAPLDVLSASSISSIEVFKVTTPDMDGQSIGGTININTPSAFDYREMFFRTNAEYGYNDFSEDADIYEFKIDWASTFGENDEFGIYFGANYWFREYVSHLYENSGGLGNPENGVLEDRLFPTRVRFGSAVGERERYGYTANFEYAPSEDSMAWFRIYYTRYDDLELRPEYTIRNRGDIGAVSEEEFFFTRYRVENETRHELTERPVIQYVLGGEQQINDAWSIEGNINYTRAKEENPFLNYYETETQTDRGNLSDGAANNPVRFRLDGDFAVPTFNPAFSDGLTPEDFAFHEVSRIRNITSEVEEETFTADIDLLWEGEWNDRFASLKFGGKFILRDKSVDDNDTRFPYRGDRNLTLGDGLGVRFRDAGLGVAYDPVPGQIIPIPDPDRFIADRNANLGDYVFDVSSSRSNSVEDDYQLDEDIYAAYVMGTVEIQPGMMLTGGVRVESTQVDVAASAFVDEVETENPDDVTRIDELPFEQSDIVDISNSNDFVNVLPAIIFKWDVDTNWLFRSSITTNIGRPDYPDVAPISQLTVTEVLGEPGVFTANNSIGNPDLDPFEAVNFDASVDYYFNENSGVLTAGVFYKHIENAIYQFRNQFDNFEFLGVNFLEYTEGTVANADDGFIAGLELVYQQDFDNGFGFLGNVSFIESEVELNSPGREGDKVPFFNQADLIYNVQVYYENNKFSARLAYNYQSEAIFDEISSDVLEDIYRNDQESLDLKLTYNFNENWSVYLTGKNLTDETDFTFYRNVNPSYIAENPGYEVYGREFRLGITWTK